MDVPKNANPGEYKIKVTAKDEKGTTKQIETITLRVTSEKIKVGGLELTSQYPDLSGPTGHTFKFTVDLKNETQKPLTAALAARSPA